ncbi:unnamed protein product [Chrysodeixis includens]|uniref:Uncharacterized protein n=1 Tax=Chrysodeixis includens TaxID=689277 RepID=A0A9P0BV82_CHRIL|nr:unnamed protein product [Chrysodeixis includens]
MKTFLVVLSVVAYVSSVPVSSEDSVLHAIVGNLANCNSDLSLCLKEQALKVSDKLSAARKLKIFDGVTLLNSNPKEARSLENLSEDPALRTKQVSDKLWERTSALLQSTELELSYAGADEDDQESRSINDEVEESRGKKKKQIKKKLKMLIPLLLLAKAKAVAIVVAAIVVIAASLFKIALIAKIAFLFKIFGIIKSLLAKKSQEESWEPHGWESHEHHVAAPAQHSQGWDGGWSRTKTEANNLAYSAYAN